MRDLDLSGFLSSEERARRRLARDFPSIPPRIIASVLEAYERILPSPHAAAKAARARLEDARAI